MRLLLEPLCQNISLITMGTYQINYLNSFHSMSMLQRLDICSHLDSIILADPTCQFQQTSRAKLEKMGLIARACPSGREPMLARLWSRRDGIMTG